MAGSRASASATGRDTRLNYTAVPAGEERMGRQRHHGDPGDGGEHRPRDPGDWSWIVCPHREHGLPNDSPG